MLRHRNAASALVALVTGLGLTASASADIVYENYSSPAGTFVVIAPGDTNPATYGEVGDVVTLGGTNRMLESINFSYANRSTPAANSLLDYSFHLYNIDGGGLPAGDPFFTWSTTDSNFTGGESGGFVRTLTFDPGTILPETFAWTFEFSNRRDNPDAPEDGMQTSFLLYSSTPPPTVGSTPDGFIYRDATTGEWATSAFTSGRQPRIRIHADPVPEPAALSVLAAGGLLMLRRRRA